MATRDNDAAIQAFNAEVEKWKELPRVEGLRRRNRVARALLSGFVLGTPVKRGRARGGWGVGAGKGTPSAIKTGKRNKGLFDKFGRKTIRHGNAIINASKFDDNIVIENSVPYILRLDNGYSRRQAPAGIIAPTFIAVRIQFF